VINTGGNDIAYLLQKLLEQYQDAQTFLILTQKIMKLKMCNLDNLKLKNQEAQKLPPLVLKPESLPLPCKFWYAVARGHTPGVYSSWTKAVPQVQGFSNNLQWSDLEAEAYKFFVAGCIHGCGRGYC
jgi:hypothetical protein